MGLQLPLRFEHKSPRDSYPLLSNGIYPTQRWAFGRVFKTTHGNNPSRSLIIHKSTSLVKYKKYIFIYVYTKKTFHLLITYVTDYTQEFKEIDNAFGYPLEGGSQRLPLQQAISLSPFSFFLFFFSRRRDHFYDRDDGEKIVL